MSHQPTPISIGLTPLPPIDDLTRPPMRRNPKTNTATEVESEIGMDKEPEVQRIPTRVAIPNHASSPRFHPYARPISIPSPVPTTSYAMSVDDISSYPSPSPNPNPSPLAVSPLMHQSPPPSPFPMNPGIIMGDPIRSIPYAGYPYPQNPIATFTYNGMSLIPNASNLVGRGILAVPQRQFFYPPVAPIVPRRYANSNHLAPIYEYPPTNGNINNSNFNTNSNDNSNSNNNNNNNSNNTSSSESDDETIATGVLVDIGSSPEVSPVKQKNTETSNINEIATPPSPSPSPSPFPVVKRDNMSLFCLTRQPDSLQRKSYVSELRYLLPNNLGIALKHSKDSSKIENATLSIELCYGNKSEMSEQKEPVFGLFHRSTLTNSIYLSGNLSSDFSCKVYINSGPEKFRLKLTVTFDYEGRPCQDIFYSDAFEIVSSKRVKAQKPNIFDIIPSSGKPLQELWIQGKSFYNPKVYFGGVEAVVHFHDSMLIKCIIPHPKDAIGKSQSRKVEISVANKDNNTIVQSISNMPFKYEQTATCNCEKQVGKQ